MKTQRQITGRRGEDAACSLLQGMGHTILVRNWRNAHREIDIISRKDAGIHFVEVKTRRAPAAEEPAYNVNYAKQQRMVRAARAWLRNDSCGGEQGNVEIFFDIVSVLLLGEELRL